MRHLLVLLLCGCSPVVTSAPVVADGELVGVRVTLDAGRVTLRGGAEAGVSGRRESRGAPGAVRVETRVEDGVLVLVGRCAGLAPCTVDVDLAVPAGVPVEVDVGSGDVQVDGLASPLTVRVGDGEVGGDGLRAERVRVTSGWGDVALLFAEAPAEVSVAVATGDVRLGLPGGGYALDLGAYDGVAVHGVYDDPAGARVHARTREGAIRVTGPGSLAGR